MSQTVIHGDTVYLAGQVPNDYSAGIKQQTEETLAKVDKLLEVRKVHTHVVQACG
jgi:enamine deaminase RidA (YjgF/YER057c/UK114 family)